MLENIKSQYILEIIFQNLKNKRKLRLIKYNKIILNRLNITKEDFKVYEALKTFNSNYHTNIEDIDIKILDLSKKKIGNEGLKDLVLIEFKYVTKLNLGENNISDINVLEKAKFKELQQLGLYNNNISDINILEKVKFDKLELLDLGENKISDILCNKFF